MHGVVLESHSKCLQIFFISLTDTSPRKDLWKSFTPVEDAMKTVLKITEKHIARFVLHTSARAIVGSIDDSKYAIFRMSPLPIPPPLLQIINEETLLCTSKHSRKYYYF